MTSRKLQVFVSSTYLDLKSERQAAVRAILENGDIPAGMELFAAGDEEQMAVIRRWIDDSDVFLLLLGARYGSIDPKSGKSYTQTEYEYALEIGKPHFALVLSDEFISSKVRAGESVEAIVERANPSSLEAFRSAVMSRMCKSVDDEKDIRLAVAQSVRDLERRHEFPGWVSGRQSSRVEKVFEDLAAASTMAAGLQRENAELREKLQEARKAQEAKSHYSGRSFEEMLRLLKSEDKVIIGGETLDFVTALYYHRDSLAGGVNNSSGSNVVTNDVFWNLGTPLLRYQLAEFGKVPASVQWQRILLSESGKRFVVEIQERIVNNRQPEARDANQGDVNTEPKSESTAKSAGESGASADAGSPQPSRSSRRRARKKK
jgi:hypothetical protein